MKKFSTLFVFVISVFIAGSSFAQAPTHPLDPLSAAEFKKTVQILKANGTASGKDLFNLINLKEPSKAEVKAFKPGMPFRREVFTSFFDFAKGGVTEAVVDLNAGKVISTKIIPNATGVGLGADTVANDIVNKDPRWVAALAKRGLTPKDVFHRFIFTGDLGMAPIGHREQLVIARRNNNRVDVEGLIAYVDFTTGKILKIVDEGNYFSAAIPDLNYFDEKTAKSDAPVLKPLIITQPEGNSITLNGHEVSWQNWKFRYGVDNREGLVIYDVRYVDNGKERSIMYRGSMPEMVVPYGSPDLFQAAYNFFDAGAYRLGQGIAKSLNPGADAPENAVYTPAILHRDNGDPYQLDRAVAIFEEYGGTLWRHGTVSKRATNLCIKYYTTIENYDYGFTWRFKEDGTITMDVELTGIVEIKGVNRKNELDMPDKNDLSYNGKYYGTLVSPHVEAIHHQHFFVFRMDMDIDGAANNSVMEMNSKVVPMATKKNPFGNAWIDEHTTFKTEKEAQRDVNYLSNRTWEVVNNKGFNATGQASGYMLMPGQQAKAFVPQDNVLLKKASFLNHQIWVTQYNENELYPAGRYPTSNKLYEGLAQWTAKNRPINNNDVVLWYVAGITHVVRPEEFPIMSAHHMGFSLMPFGFFSGNPTMTQGNPDFIKKTFPDVKVDQGDGIEHN